jgi:hypothetical protein
MLPQYQQFTPGLKGSEKGDQVLLLVGNRFERSTSRAHVFRAILATNR